MNRYKKYSYRSIIGIVTIITIIIFLNYIVDPFQQYREAKFYTFKVQKQRYLNAGLIKNYKYDSLVIGSSMMANFDCDLLSNELDFNKTIKALDFGGVISEEVYTFNRAKRYNKINNVLLSLDLYSFSKFNIPIEKNSRFPLFLYDDTILNDQKYLLNFKVFRESIKSLKNRYDKNIVDNNLNRLYDWQDEYNDKFSGKELINDYNMHLNKIDKDNKSIYSFDILKRNFDKFLIPIVKDNKEINFYLFYPPYSVYAYILMAKSGYLSDYIKFKEYIFNELNKYGNVKLYDFQIVDSFILNNRNYKDIFHYHKRVNVKMIEYIKRDKYLVTKNNFIKYKKLMSEQVKILERKKKNEY